MLRRIVPLGAILALLAVGLTGAVRHPAPVTAQQTSPVASPCPATTPEQNVALVRRYFEDAWGHGDVAILGDLLTNDYVGHSWPLGVSVRRDATSTSGTAAITQIIQNLRADFPDLRVTIEQVVAQGDTVAIRMTYAGAQADPLAGFGAPNTGRRMAKENVSFVRIACGKIAEEWNLPDNLTMLRQLGIIDDQELADAATPTVATPAP